MKVENDQFNKLIIPFLFWKSCQHLQLPPQKNPLILLSIYSFHSVIIILISGHFGTNILQFKETCDEIDSALQRFGHSALPNPKPFTQTAPLCVFAGLLRVLLRVLRALPAMQVAGPWLDSGDICASWEFIFKYGSVLNGCFCLWGMQTRKNGQMGAV